ncbi:MAG: hypothetical protein COT88_00395 [Candidatus Colwellbacteria bacterium CG10_big_fil_rev_8_21_14_0_10_41_28]|uniref:Uncharacterized protein n=1 Tax=Candidatus Colwellbacteria bacterium CG10_big_fil_rev_8_21_14_0_10_41_28 TaxID=1974539 RepID=A0A2H0VK05_9BACT|nr:MAG: hypothetical protein COT88_00395 [Candidatus Colwellbacteria bacterium CG10_big_fil_rev_8_21_14_0_10_41_28]
MKKKFQDSNPKSVVTLFSSISINRDHPTKALTIVDLENSVSQAVWKFFDHCRSDAAERLGTNEMDLALTDARILGVKIDGHKVLNPNGFTGKTLEITLSISIVKGGDYEEGKLILDGGAVRGYMLADEIGDGEHYYIEVSSEDTRVYKVSLDEVTYINDFDWGVDKVYGVLEDELLLDFDTAKGVYAKYARGDVSDHIKRRIDKHFYDNFSEMMDILKESLGNIGRGKKSFYLNSSIELPENIYRKRFNLGNVKIGFSKPDKELDVEIFLDDNIHGIYEDFNDLAIRRMKWLIPTK